MTVSPPAARMARIATGLLVLMAAVFVAADHLAARHQWLGYVRAFAEASMVGGLADWFAVTALFRHPLGVPIPHTAIVPRNKERIAVTLANFLRDNFLVPGIIAKRVEGLDLAGAIARRLVRPEPSGELRQGFADLARGLLMALDDAAIAAMIRGGVVSRLAMVDVSSLFADLIDRAVENGRQGALIDAGLKWASAALTDNEAFIREQVRERAGWFVKLAGLDAEISDRIIGALTTLMSELAADPAHPMRLKATGTLVGLAFDLRHDAATRTKVDALKADLLAHPTVSVYLDSLWASAKAAMLRAANDPGALTHGPVGGTLARLGAQLEADGAMREAVNGYARRAIVATAVDHGGVLVGLVSDTIRGWETRTIVDKLEGVVGRDLQYIRINGTVIGGLAGLTIHLLSKLF